MVALNRDDIPSTISTVEQLLVFAHTAMVAVAGRTTISEGGDTPIIAFTSSVFPVITTTPPEQRLAARFSLKVSDRHGSKPIWEEVEEFSTETLPSSFFESSSGNIVA